ncbi:hypothetical protein ES703_73040 [subsurface metagenome]
MPGSRLDPTASPSRIRGQINPVNRLYILGQGDRVCQICLVILSARHTKTLLPLLPSCQEFQPKSVSFVLFLGVPPGSFIAR